MGKKHWIRKIVLALIGAAIVTGIILSINIEPADYRDTLQGEITNAEELLQEAETGNAPGLYAPQTVLLFRHAVEEASSVEDDENAEYEQLKEASQKLKERAEWFQNARNTDCLTAEEQKEIVPEQGVEKTVEGESFSVTWKLLGVIDNPADVNLKVNLESAYEQEVQALLQACDAVRPEKVTLLTLYHDGALPAEFSLTAEPLSLSADGVQIYRYNPESGGLDYLIRGEVQGETLTFSVAEGGTYLIYNKSAEETLLTTLLESGAPEAEPEEPAASETSDTSSSESSTPEPSQPNTPAADLPDSPSSTPSVSPPSASGADGSESQSAPDAKKYCTIEIRCDTVANDLSKLKNPEIRPYIPSDGVILAKQQVEVYDGETVFDILKRVTRNKRIQLEFRNDKGYTGGVYIEGINHLYEFHGGDLSGWMYSVNGWFPNYGAAAYTVQDGDEILWCYTCDLGKDVGGYFE